MCQWTYIFFEIRDVIHCLSVGGEGAFLLGPLVACGSLHSLRLTPVEDDLLRPGDLDHLGTVVVRSLEHRGAVGGQRTDLERGALLPEGRARGETKASAYGVRENDEEGRSVARLTHD